METFMSTFIITCLCFPILSSKIFFHGMHASDSHVGSMLPAMTSLAEAGHFVELLETHYKTDKYKLPNSINHTFIRFKDDPYSNDSVFEPMWHKYLSIWDLPLMWSHGENAFIELFESHYEKFFPTLNSSFDLTFCDELFGMTGYGLSMRSKKLSEVPYIIFSTTTPMEYFTYLESLGHNSLTRPTFYHTPGVQHDLTKFSHRLKQASHALILGIGIKINTEYFLKKGMSYMGLTGYFSMQKLVNEASFYYFEDLNYYTFPSAIGHDTIHTGFHCFEDENLPTDYRNFVEDPNSKGTIYIAFGSNVPWSFAPHYLLMSFLDGLNKMTAYKVIFVFNGDDKPIRNIKDHIKVVRWAPQKAVLAHKNTKLYITHGGLKSLKETICSDVPALFMPLFAEQSMNAEMARSMGFAEVLVKTNFTMEDFVNKMKLMLENPSYLQTISRFHNMMLDRVVSSKDLLVFYARRAIKLGSNVQKFKRKGQFLPLIDHLYIIAISFYGFLIYLCST